ncbi:MAG: peroxiredoxin [Sphingomonadaceae bacterium]|nr:peroxiredoxin [Sphingomonadaceae bacterium]
MHVGMEIPNVCLKLRVRDADIDGPNPYRWQDTFTHSIFKAKQVVMFGLPGAFTPTCSSAQLPGFDNYYESFVQYGIDDIICASVNDAFVMHQWAQHQQTINVKLLPDGNGILTRRLGMLVDKSHLGFGLRSWRYAAVVHDGTIAAWFQEPGINDIGSDDDPYQETRPENVLEWLENR